MKNILIATDFSDAAVNAGKFAVELARHFKAKVFLFNGYKAPLEIPESYLFYTVEHVAGDAMACLDAEIKQINKYGIVQIEKLVAEGVSATTIIAEAKRINADLIVCGMKGKGKTMKKIFGSIVTSLARKTTIPMIIVPEEAKFRLLNNIVFASDMTSIPCHKNIQVLKEIGKEFDSKLAVVTVIDGHSNEGFQFRERYLDFMEELKFMQPSLESLYGFGIASLLEKYVEENFINLIAMVPHEHSFLSGIFSGSITKQMSFLCHVPLLVLPDSKDPVEIRDAGLGMGNPNIQPL